VSRVFLCLEALIQQTGELGIVRGLILQIVEFTKLRHMESTFGRNFKRMLILKREPGETSRLNDRNPEKRLSRWNTLPPEHLLSYLSVENRDILYSLMVKLLISVCLFSYKFIVYYVFQCSTYPQIPCLYG